MVFKKGQKPWNKDKKLSKEHIEKIKENHSHSKPWLGKKRPSMIGDKNPRWSGGEARTTQRQHARKAFEEHFGMTWKEMLLPKDTIIHHINGDFTDNRFENLDIMSRSNHTKLHHKQGDIRGRRQSSLHIAQ